MLLKGKTVVLGISSSIAVYKAAQLCSDLVKLGADVQVIMTRNATEFVGPLTFETLTGNRVSVDTFDRNFQWNVQHVALAKRADVFFVVPATANIIAKMACGIADDMLSTTALAMKCPVIVAPAMNTNMYENPVTQRNLATLRELGITIIEPVVGRLACADTGKGKLADIPQLLDAVLTACACKKDYAGLRVLVTAGATCEKIDPVRFVTNHSSGKMGIEIARAAHYRGAEVTLVHSSVSAPLPFGVECVPALSALEMYDAVMQRSDACDIIIKAAAVADFRPEAAAREKIKKGNDDRLELHMVKNPDILAALGEKIGAHQVLCGFSMETQDLLVNSQKKLLQKHADLIVANSLTEQGAGFGVDTNIASMISATGIEQLPIMSKFDLGMDILDRALELLRQKRKNA